MMNKLIRYDEISHQQIKDLQKAGFVIRWICHLEEGKELVEIYVRNYGKEGK